MKVQRKKIIENINYQSNSAKDFAYISPSIFGERKKYFMKIFPKFLNFNKHFKCYKNNTFLSFLFSYNRIVITTKIWKGILRS